MRVRYTALLASTALLATAHAAAAQREVRVQAATVQSLDAKLRAFAQGLAPAERAAWNTVLRQAAGAPADNPAGVPVRAMFYAGCGCTTGSPGAIIVQGGRSGIVVQGGRTAVSPRIIVQGGTQPSPGANPASQGAQEGTPSPAIIVQGGTPATRAAGVGGGPTRPGGDPAAVGPGGGCLAMSPRGGATSIGPKPDDPLVVLDAKVHAFATSLSGSEQAVFDWMLQRAATQGQRDPGGMPAGRTPSLGQALGLLAIGPKQDDPAPPPPSNVNVLLRF